jgi:hypothetical protein
MYMCIIMLRRMVSGVIGVMQHQQEQQQRRHVWCSRLAAEICVTLSAAVRECMMHAIERGARTQSWFQANIAHMWSFIWPHCVVHEPLCVSCPPGSTYMAEMCDLSDHPFSRDTYLFGAYVYGCTGL